MSRNATTDTARAAHPKVTGQHQERWAYIYVRQSSLKQVLHNQESQQYQYRLQQRAEELGWPVERIRIIDTDLGRSGREAESRTGFQELVSEVSLGHVGIVLSYEASRLARNNRDWYHLLDLAAMFGVLIADTDGVYDPRLYNDRLLLGLKGTMSEAELYMLRQRLDEGRLNAVKRGAYRQQLPTGLVRLPDGTVVKDPDEQVQHVLELMFERFEVLGSVNKVVRYLRRHQVLLPRRQTTGPQVGQVVWKVASEAAVSDILQNPAYAGAFAYGRRQIEPARRQPGRPAAGRIRKPMSEWLHLEQDAYPAYISWEQYLANQERIRQNGLRFVENFQKAQGIVREGAGLLQGLAVCGHCAYHMQTVYKHTPRYFCRGHSRTTDVGPCDCTLVRAPAVDEVVVQAFFEAIQPAQLDALEAILAAQQQERQQLERQWQEQLRRTEYEAALAQRQYDAVDPDNRLVAAELERRWEEKLLRLRQAQEDYHHFQQAPLPDTIPPGLREQFQAVSERLPELWPRLPNAHKKELLRSLIRRVIIRRPAADRLEIRIVWISGGYTDRTAWTPILRERDVSGYDQMVERVRELWQQGCDDEQMAEYLTAEGFHTARSWRVNPLTVQKIRLERQWYLPFEQLRRQRGTATHWTVRGLAEQIPVNTATVFRYIYNGVIPAGHVTHDPQTGLRLIAKDEALLARLRQRVSEKKRQNGMISAPSEPGGDNG